MPDEDMVSTGLRTPPTAKTGVAAAAQRATSAAAGDLMNDGVVAASSILLIGSFFWVGVIQKLPITSSISANVFRCLRGISLNAATPRAVCNQQSHRIRVDQLSRLLCDLPRLLLYQVQQKFA